MFILISTPIGRTEDGNWIDYFPSRWSYAAKPYRQAAYYPHSLAYLSSYLKSQTKHAVKMIDPTYLGMLEDEYISTISRFSPDVWVVEIDALISRQQSRIISVLRNQGYKGKIVACGPYPSARPEEVLSWGVDFIAVGEFEQSVCDLALTDFSAKEGTIKGIYPNREPNPVDFDKLPFPEDTDIKRRDYCRLPCVKYRQLEMFSTRGCSYSCDYCVAANLYYRDHRHRVRSYDSIIAEIKYLAETVPGFEGILFNEEAHTLNPKFIRGLCEKLIETGLNRYHYTCMTTYGSLDAELMALMKKAGYCDLQVGVESLSTAHIENDRPMYLKKTDKRKLMTFLETARDLNFHIFATMTFGAPGSTYESDMATLDEVEQLYAEGLITEISVSVTIPFIGTKFYNDCTQKGYIANAAGFNGKMDCPISYPWYSSDKIKIVMDRALALSDELLRKDREKGIHFSSWDREWCAPVFALNDRKPGERIDWSIPEERS